MKTDSCYECSERRQLDFIQRVGRIGYWEYDSAQRAMTLPSASVDLLACVVGGPHNSRRTFMDALGDLERERFQIALDQAAANKLALNVQLKLARVNGDHAHIVVRGAPLDPDQGPLRFAGTFQDISQEIQREIDHENVITQMQALLDALPQGVSVVDKNLELMLWNQRLPEILDFPQSLVFRHARFEDFIRFNAARGDYGPGDPDEQVQAIVTRAREFLPHSFERQLTGGRTVLVEGFPFRSDGEISGFVTTYTDITDQKRTEEQLTRQRDVMKTVIDNFPGAISLCDTDLRFTTYNDQFLELLDFPPSLFTKGWVDFEDLVRFNVKRGEYGPGDPEEQVRASVTRAHNFQAHRIERARPNGRWLEIRGTPIPSGGFVTSYVDITERKLIEAELVHSKETAEARREQVASLLDNSGQGFLSFGSDLLVQAEYSRACKTMLGLSPAGQDAAQLLFADDGAKADLLRDIIPSVLAEPDPGTREIMLSLLPTEIRRDDLILKAEYKILDHDKFMLVLTDMTEERRMAALLDRERRHLELIVKAASDSRNFFETIDGFHEFLAQGLPHLLNGVAAPQSLAKALYREIHT